MIAMKPERYPLFDWLRLGLALNVLLGHSRYICGLHGGQPPMVPAVLPMVPTFLALSGYLVLRSFEHSRGYGHFVWKRALRILPLLLATFALTAVLLGRQAGIDSVIQYLTASRVQTQTQPNGSLWSLGWEELAYLVLAVLSSLTVYRKAPWAIWAMLGGACWLSWRLEGLEAWWRVGNLAPAFLIGNLIYLNEEKVKGLPWQVLAVALATVVAARFAYSGIQYGTWYVVPCAFLSVALCLTAPQPKEVPVDLSYSAYVLHDPILAWVAGLGIVSFWPLLGISSVLIFGLGFLSWTYLETPCLRLKDWRLHRRDGLNDPVRAAVAPHFPALDLTNSGG